LVAGVTAAARGKAVRCGFGAKAAARRDAAARGYRGRPKIPGDSMRKRRSRIRLGMRHRAC